MDTLEVLPINPLDRAIQMNRTDNIKVLLADARTNFVFSTDPQKNMEKLKYILPDTAFEIMNLLIHDYRFDTQAAALDLPQSLNRTNYIRLLLQRPDINVDNPAIVTKIAEKLTYSKRVYWSTFGPNDPKVAQSAHLIFYAEQINPNTFLREFFVIPYQINPVILADWLKEPRLNLATLSDGLLLSLIYLTPPEILGALMFRLPYLTRVRLYQLATHPDLFPEPKYSARDIVEMLQPFINPETVPPEDVVLEPDLNQYLSDRACEIDDVNRAYALMD